MSCLTCYWNLFATIQRAHVTFTVEHFGKQEQSSIVYKVANSAAVISVSFRVDKQLTTVCSYSSHLCARDWNYKYLTGKNKHFLETCFLVSPLLSLIVSPRGFLEFFLRIKLSPNLRSCKIFDLRDRLTADDCVGTGYLPISAISGQGDDGKATWLFASLKDPFDYAMFCVTFVTSIFTLGMANIPAWHTQ